VISPADVFDPIYAWYSEKLSVIENGYGSSPLPVQTLVNVTADISE